MLIRGCALLCIVMPALMPVYSRITNAVRSVEMKKYSLARCGCFLAMCVQTPLTRYRSSSDVRPKAASIDVVGRPLSVLMMTLYGASRVLTPLMPISLGTWPAAMLTAEPVMKAQMDGSGMNSTTQPRRARPRKQMMAPAMMARAEAMTWPGTSGRRSAALNTTSPVT
jgi:hypothetical protein